MPQVGVPAAGGGLAAEVRSTWQPSFATDIALTLARLRRGAGDPTHRVAADGALWRTTLTDDGPASMRFTQLGLHTLTCEAWGDGARAAVAAAPVLLGARDDPSGFVADHPRLHDAHRRWPGLRVPCTGRVLESLIPAILEQKVISLQAMASWRALVRGHGTTAPGPTPSGMLVVPSARAWQLIPSWEWHRAGVDPKRSRTVMAAVAVARQLQAATRLAPDDAARRLQAVPGIGVWTTAEVAQRAFGDADALSVGDYHLADTVGHSLFGRHFSDADMLIAMEKWRPHRYRVVRLLEVSGAGGKPRHGPRLSFVDHRGH
ncbi:MAG: DNA-3-methyladenine glycosylase 2 family protein [Cryobacterium sp.]